jgi:hypothetical protein
MTKQTLKNGIKRWIASAGTSMDSALPVTPRAAGLKFVHGYAGDAPCADAFKIVHYVLQDWLNPDEEE